jgi:hypothetical protein
MLGRPNPALTQLQAEAEEEVLQILDLYARVYTDLLAVPVCKARAAPGGGPANHGLSDK